MDEWNEWGSSDRFLGIGNNIPSLFAPWAQCTYHYYPLPLPPTILSLAQRGKEWMGGVVRMFERLVGASGE